MILPLCIRSSKITFLCLGFLMSSCAQYEVTLNDQIVYSPPALFTDYSIEDRALLACVQSNIEENGIRSADELEVLRCAPGNISSLSGIEVFRSLKQLGLAGNQVDSITEILSLQQLQQLDLSDNKLEEVSGEEVIRLNTLEALAYLDLRGNPLGSCSNLRKLTLSGQILLPEAC